MTFKLMCVHSIFLVRFGLLSGHLLGKSCSLFINFVIFCFGFEGCNWVLIVSVPGLCILVTVNFLLKVP